MSKMVNFMLFYHSLKKKPNISSCPEFQENCQIKDTQLSKIQSMVNISFLSKTSKPDYEEVSFITSIQEKSLAQCYTKWPSQDLITEPVLPRTSHRPFPRAPLCFPVGSLGTEGGLLWAEPQALQGPRKIRGQRCQKLGGGIPGPSAWEEKTMQVKVQGQLSSLGGSQVQASEEDFIQDLEWERHGCIQPPVFQPVDTSSKGNGSEALFFLPWSTAAVLSLSLSLSPSLSLYIYICTHTHTHTHTHTLRLVRDSHLLHTAVMPSPLQFAPFA
jgi:hypothetical protein